MELLWLVGIVWFCMQIVVIPMTIWAAQERWLRYQREGYSSGNYKRQLRSQFVATLVTAMLVTTPIAWVLVHAWMFVAVITSICAVLVAILSGAGKLWDRWVLPKEQPK